MWPPTIRWVCGPLLAAVVLCGLLGACSSDDASLASEAEEKCVQLCERHRDVYRTDLSAGPCLSDTLPEEVITPDFVCDVAHRPRQAADDLTQNQCATYVEGRARHFVEVDPDCTTLLVQ